MPTKLQLEATEKHNLICRLKEEELLILKEMKSYVSFYQRSIAELQDSIRGMRSTIASTIHSISKITNSMNFCGTSVFLVWM